jgi:uncharacterized membrane protein YbhN (UPF0104 family)
MDRVKRTAWRVITTAVVVAGVWYALRGVSVPLLLQALRGAHLPFVGITGLALLGVAYVVRTARYAALLPALAKPAPFSALWAGVVLSAAGNNVLPLRAGELVRTRHTQGCGYPLRDVATAQVAEKVVEALTLTACVVPVLAQWVGVTRTALGVVALAVVVRMLVPRVLARIRMTPRQLARSAAWSLCGDVLEIALIATCMAGLSLPTSVFGCVTVYAGVNLAIAVPSTPGQVGAFEAGAALPLIAMGVDRDAAIAFALVYRAVQWIPVTAAGMVLWGHQLVAERSLSRQRTEGT